MKTKYFFIISTIVLLSACVSVAQKIAADGKYFQVSIRGLPVYEFEYLSSDFCARDAETFVNQIFQTDRKLSSALNNGELTIKCSPISLDKWLTYKGSATNNLTGEVMTVRTKSRESCILLKNNNKDERLDYKC